MTNPPLPRRQPLDAAAKVATAFLVGLFCWPFEAAFMMWGLALLHGQGFGVPTPGYWSSFLVSLGGDLILGAVTLTRRTLEGVE